MPAEIACATDARPDVNRYLKWAFSEAANSTAVNYRRFPQRHVSQLYARLRARKRTAQSGGRGGTAFGGGRLPRAEPSASVSRSDAFGSRNECDTPPEYVHARDRAKR